MKLIQGNAYIWQGKRAFIFLEKIGREYFFSCSDYASPGNPGTVTLKAHELKNLQSK